MPRPSQPRHSQATHESIPSNESGLTILSTARGVVMLTECTPARRLGELGSRNPGHKLARMGASPDLVSRVLSNCTPHQPPSPPWSRYCMRFPGKAHAWPASIMPHIEVRTKIHPASVHVPQGFSPQSCGSQIEGANRVQNRITAHHPDYYRGER